MVGRDKLFRKHNERPEPGARAAVQARHTPRPDQLKRK
jgi:hypothetical protein